MPRDVIADTGFLYALFDRDDQHHDLAVSIARGGQDVFLTSLAVVGETVHLLKRCRLETRIDFLRWVQLGGASVVDLVADDFDPVITTMLKYGDLPADFADATLVAIADRLGINRVATFDRDFEVYRYQGRSRFRNVLR